MDNEHPVANLVMQLRIYSWLRNAVKPLEFVSLGKYLDSFVIPLRALTVKSPSYQLLISKFQSEFSIISIVLSNFDYDDF